MNSNVNKWMIASLPGLLLAITAMAASDLPRTSPAKFKPDAAAFAASIEFPEALPEGRHILRCSGGVTKKGHLRSVNCDHGDLTEGAGELAIAAISRAIKVKSRVLAPAELRGYRRAVWFNFSVIFERIGDWRKTTVVENHQLNVVRYGLDYTAPQRVLARRFPNGCRPVVLLFAVAEISASGEASKARIVSSSGDQPGICRERTIRTMTESQYIPATLEGEPVTATYDEIFYTSNAF